MPGPTMLLEVRHAHTRSRQPQQTQSAYKALLDSIAHPDAVSDQAPALSEMIVGMARSERANAAIARLRLPGVRAAASSTTCMFR